MTIVASVRAVVAGSAMLLLGPPVSPAQAPEPGPSASPEANAARAAFNATWKLDADASEKLRDKMRQAHAGERGGGGGGFGGGGRGGFGGGRGGFGGRHGGGGGGADPDGTSSGGLREEMEKLDNPAETLTIKQEGPVFLIGDDSGQLRRLTTDGRSVKMDNGAGETRTRWHGDELVTETIPTRGPRLRETFAVAPGGKRLFVTTHIEPPSGTAVDVKRVYNIADTP